jgi:hypothetical protein
MVNFLPFLTSWTSSGSSVIRGKGFWLPVQPSMPSPGTEQVTKVIVRRRANNNSFM